MGESYRIFVNVDVEGNIKGDYSGKDIVMTEPYHYCFIKTEDVAENLHQYKVIVRDMVPQLIPKNESV